MFLDQRADASTRAESPLGWCKYKDVFGKPNEGIRKIRIFNLSVVDVVPTILLGLTIAVYFKMPKSKGIAIAFGTSVVFHAVFCVETTLVKMLFGS